MGDMTAPACESWKALLAGYLYEDLDPASRARVQAHLGECAACRTALTSMREASAALDAWTLPARAARPKPRIASGRRLPAIAAAAAVLFAVLLYVALRNPAPTPSAPRTAVRPPEKVQPVAPPPVEPAPIPVAPPPAPPESSRPPVVAPQPPPPAPPLQPEAPPSQPPPPPKKEPPPAPRPSPTIVVIAQLEWAHGDVRVGAAAKPRSGARITSGEGVESVGPASVAVVRFNDGTRLELEGDTQIRSLTDSPEAGKRIDLVKGAVTADVARQPAGRALVLATPHAEARVLGTRLRLATDAEGTRLDVREGRVRFTRTRDGATTEVGAGTFSVTSAPRLTPRPVREVSFQDGVAPIPGYAGTRDTFLSQTNPANTYGAKATLQVDGDNPSGSGNDLNLMLRWDLSALPRGNRIQTAHVTLRAAHPTDAPFPVHALRRAWTEEDATWKNASAGAPWQEPGAAGARDRGAAPVGALVPLGGDVYVLRLTAEGIAVVQSWIDAPDSNFGLVVPGAEHSNGLQAHSREFSDAVRRPKLTVTYLPK